MKLKEELGNRYGMLFVVGKQNRAGSCRAYWFCECDCGNLHAVLGDHLRSGAIQSCGCTKPVARPSLRPRKQRKSRAKLRGYSGNVPFYETIKPHVYRTPRRIDMGPIVAAARAAVAARRAV